MIVNSRTAFSLHSIVDNNILTDDGCLCKVYAMEMPERNSLSQIDFDRQHKRLFLALRTMPKGTYVHKQEIGLEKAFDASHLQERNLLERAYKKHVEGRPFMEHRTLLIFSITDLKMMQPTTVKNPIGYKSSFQNEDLHRIQKFEEAVRGCIGILGQSKITINALQEFELKGYIKDYCNGFTGYNTDIEFDLPNAKMGILQNRYEVLAIPKQEYLPDTINNIVEDYGDQEYIFYKGFIDDFGESFPFNHIYNQVLFFKGHSDIKREIEASHLNHSQNKGWSPSIEQDVKEIEENLKDISKDSSNILLQAHFNLMLWSNNEERLRDALEAADQVIKGQGMEYYLASEKTIQNLFLGSMPGRNSLLHEDMFFEQPLGQSLCLFTNTGNYVSDETGVLYNDRIHNIPVLRDLWDRSKKRINARNSIRIAPTGGGKSFAMLWKLFQELMQGIVVCLIEIGSSADIFAKLFPHLAVQIKFEYDKPLGVNPFKLEEGQELDNRKVMLLSALCFKFWQQKTFKENTDTDKAMRKLIRYYYKSVSSNHSFPNFYEFIKANKETVLLDLEIPQRFFDIESFIHVCSEFMPGGGYANVCADTDTPLEKIIEGKQFIHFELSKVKEDPFLVSIMIHLINYVIDTKILSDRSKRAKIVYDEFAETQELKTTLSEDHVLATVAFLYQKIRKENGGVDIVIQSPTQLPDNEYTKNIIANTQILHVQEGNELVYKKTKELLELKDHDEYLMRSIENRFKGDPGSTYSEEYLMIGKKYRNILRLNVPKEIYYAFQTEGNDWDWMQKDFQRTQNMEETIMNIIREKHENTTNFN